MRRRSRALKTRFFGNICLTMLLSIAFLTSCAKLPRRYLHSSKQTAPPVSRRGVPLININTASAEALEKLPAIGKGLSERIIAYRKEYGRFRRPEHLLMVRGISTRRYLAMQPLITAE